MRILSDPACVFARTTYPILGRVCRGTQSSETVVLPLRISPATAQKARWGNRVRGGSPATHVACCATHVGQLIDRVREVDNSPSNQQYARLGIPSVLDEV